MPVTRLSPFNEQVLTTTASSINSTTGLPRVYLPLPFRGKLMEVGFIAQNASITTSVTMAAAINNQGSTIGSTYVQVFDSSAVQFLDSTLLYQGALCSTVASLPTPFSRGDTLEVTLSGGNSLQVQVYAIVRRA